MAKEMMQGSYSKRYEYKPIIIVAVFCLWKQKFLHKIKDWTRFLCIKGAIKCISIYIYLFASLTLISLSKFTQNYSSIRAFKHSLYATY